MSRVGVVIVAAGAGTRLRAELPKALVEVAGRPLVGYAVSAALRARDVGWVVVAAPPTHVGQVRTAVEASCRAAGVALTVVPGGAHRGDSVLAALRELPEQAEVVLVHDAARALAPVELFDRVAAAVDADHPAVVPGLPVIDTIKAVDADGRVLATPDRDALRIIQTPQGFLREVLLAAHAEHGSLASDDAGLVERLGRPAYVVRGDPRALKVTTAPDLGQLERWVGTAAAPGESGATRLTGVPPAERRRPE
ncbi:MAG: 2-C-methyl-D-erythritol 4-phosphate cytidylyltransferase [Dermatophilaceae bacterium]